jgi:RNA polymerase-binding transcription factor DksA
LKKKLAQIKAAKKQKELEKRKALAERKRLQKEKQKEAQRLAKERAKLKAQQQAERLKLKLAKEKQRQEEKQAREAAKAAKLAAREAARLAEIEANRKPVAPPKPPIIKGVMQDGITPTKEFNIEFLMSQRELLIAERRNLLGQADQLENEANAIVENSEMGDVQFDDEGGEGDTMVVERERDLTLSASARQTVEEIDEALKRLETGDYGYSSRSGLPIPRERLKAIPWTTELVVERAGGIGSY